MTKEELLKKIGQRIVQIRKEKGIKSSKLAESSDKERQTAYKWEIGSNSKIYTFYQIAEALGVPLSTLFDFQDDKKNEK